MERTVRVCPCWFRKVWLSWLFGAQEVCGLSAQRRHISGSEGLLQSAIRKWWLITLEVQLKNKVPFSIHLYTSFHAYIINISWKVHFGNVFVCVVRLINKSLVWLCKLQHYMDCHDEQWIWIVKKCSNFIRLVLPQTINWHISHTSGWPVGPAGAWGRPFVNKYTYIYLFI